MAVPENALRALVTGGARGIGLTISRHLVDAGYDVTIVDRDTSVGDVAAAVGASSACIDLADPSATRELRSAVDDRPCWLLVNNAGVFDRTPLLDIELDRWNCIQSMNTTSMVAVMQAFVPSMIAAGHGGRIVNMSSMAAKLGTAGESAYAASKAAVVALSRIAAMEFGEHDITVNSICPGYVLTDMGADTRSDADVAAWSAKSPLGRLATPDDIASLVVYLASSKAAYVTGQALNVTGGMCTS